MEIALATIGRLGNRKQASAEQIFADYCERIGHYCQCRTANYPTEEKFLAAIGRATPARVRNSGNAAKTGTAASSPSKRAIPMLILLDSRGRSFSTEEFAAWLSRQREQGTRHLLFAIGPADGWSEAARQSVADGRGILLSLGPMTLPHELAAVVLAEQIYRAFTIVEGHPYHLGHR